MKIKVMFRIENDGQVLAVFPDCLASPAKTDMLFTCYSHIGQHSSCAIHYVLYATKPATKAQYQDLYNELAHNVGYDCLKVVKSTKMLEERLEALLQKK